MDKRSQTSADNGKKGGRPIASATLRAQMMRERLSEAVDEQFEEMFTPQIEKAKNGDTTAFLAIIDRVGLKPVEHKVVENVKKHRLDDPELQQKAEALVELQKHGITGTEGSA